MEGRKIDDNTYAYPCDGYTVWAHRFIYIDDVRNSFCPNCDTKFEFPEGIEEKIICGCPGCKTPLFFHPPTGIWYYLPKDYTLDKSICPECEKTDRPQHPDLRGFYYCLDCDVEFQWQMSPIHTGLLCTKFKYKDGQRLMNREEMNRKYGQPDPFGVKTDKADSVRKGKIISALKDWVTEKRGGQLFKRALDIGCGEGFITAEIPAEEIVGYDPSDVALSRCPEGIITVDNPATIEGEFDCIIATGVLVREYDFVQILNLIDAHAADFVLTCQTDVTEVHEVANLKGTQIHLEPFDYREHKQIMRIFSYADHVKLGDSDEGPMHDGSTVELKVPMKVNVNVDVDAEIDPPAEGEKEPGKGEDKTFKEIIDEEIDTLPDGSDRNAILLSEDLHFQLTANEDISDHYRGFKLIISAEGDPYSFVRHEPDEVPESEAGKRKGEGVGAGPDDGDIKPDTEKPKANF